MREVYCEACNPPEKYKELEITEGQYWKVGLHSNQFYLGRCVVVLKRHVDDLLDVTEEERGELFDITKRLRDTVRELFNVDMFNYAAFGNEVGHTHLHFIPRYQTKRDFLGVIFEDKNWGKNYAPYDRNFSISQEVKLAIRDKIRDGLNNS